MALPDSLREFLGKAENNVAKWLLVAIGMVILVRLKLVLFAAALPVMAYWHFSNQLEDGSEGEPGASDDRAVGAGADGVWPPEDEREDEEAEDDDGCTFQSDEHGGAPLAGGRTDNDPYDQSFWSQSDAGASAKRTAPWRNASRATPAAASTVPVAASGDEDAVPGDFSNDLVAGDIRERPAERSRAKQFGMSWVADADLDDTQELDLGLSSNRGLAGRSNANAKDPLSGRDGMGDLLDGLGDLGFGDPGKMPAFGGSSTFGSSALDDFDLGGSDGLDFLSMGGKGRGKGKGKSKGGDKGGPRDPMAPREANPKQVFVANVGDLAEEEIRSFFEDVGEVDRLKVLRNPDGGSKGVCFVTFRTEEQAQKALSLHGSSLEGKNLVVRMAHGGNKGSEKGGDSRGKGGGLDRFGGGGTSEGPLDLGGSERFGAAFGMDRDRERGDRGDRSSNLGGKGGRGGKGAGGRRIDRGEMDDLLEEALADGDGPIKPADFDFAARRFLSELRARDRNEGTARFQEAVDMVIKYTSSKDRASVRKWPAYIFALLQKFDPNLWEELRERDAERKREKGGGSGVGFRERRSFD